MVLGHCRGFAVTGRWPLGRLHLPEAPCGEPAAGSSRFPGRPLAGTAGPGRQHVWRHGVPGQPLRAGCLQAARTILVQHGPCALLFWSFLEPRGPRRAGPCQARSWGSRLRVLEGALGQRAQPCLPQGRAWLCSFPSLSSHTSSGFQLPDCSRGCPLPSWPLAAPAPAGCLPWSLYHLLPAPCLQAAPVQTPGTAFQTLRSTPAMSPPNVLRRLPLPQGVAESTFQPFTEPTHPQPHLLPHLCLHSISPGGGLCVPAPGPLLMLVLPPKFPFLPSQSAHSFLLSLKSQLQRCLLQEASLDALCPPASLTLPSDVAFPLGCHCPCL